jgi:FKBP-type peptidyl-prolyl cis-trans isomerase FkpA
MSAAEAAHRPEHRGRSARLWLAIALIIAAAIGLAWLGAGSLRGMTTASGLQIRTIEEGSGAFVQPMDGVLIEYEGRLEDGTVFDSSAGRGPTPMIAGQVIPGFAEALGMMQEGGRYRIRIPSQLAYGQTPPPGSPIPPNADLSFDVEVVQVVPNAALMMGPGGQPQPGQPNNGGAVPGQSAPVNGGGPDAPPPQP